MKNIYAPIFVIDFEGSRKIGVVEYGIVEIYDGKIAGTGTRICAPRTAIPRKDAEFFGISNAEALAEEPFGADIADFCKMRRRGIFASHNAPVEDSLLRDTLPTPGIVPNAAGELRETSWGPWIDTCVLAKTLYPTLETAKLADVVGALGLQKKLDANAEKFCPPNRRKWHCALYDALASAQILLNICEQEGFEGVTLSWLAQYSGNAEAAQHSLF